MLYPLHGSTTRTDYQPDHVGRHADTDCYLLISVTRVTTRTVWNGLLRLPLWSMRPMTSVLVDFSAIAVARCDVTRFRFWFGSTSAGSGATSRGPDVGEVFCCRDDLSSSGVDVLLSAGDDEDRDQRPTGEVEGAAPHGIGV